MTGVRAGATDEKPPSPREIEVGKMIAHGFRNKDIARHLSISESTVHVHRYNLMKKVDAHNAAQLVMWLVRNGYMAIEEDRNGQTVSF